MVLEVIVVHGVRFSFSNYVSSSWQSFEFLDSYDYYFTDLSPVYLEIIWVRDLPYKW